MDWTVFTGVIVAALMVTGLVGSTLLVLPGLALIWASTLLWAVVAQTTAGWWAFGLATVIAVIASVAVWLVPGRRMKRAGISNTTLLAGVAGGIVGFFVVPVVGLFLGFVAGVFLSESVRRRTGGLTPWQATVHALKAVGTNVLIEILAGLLIIGVWIASLILPVLF
ncbi:DUF456 domain-containing protein [Kytococcus sedentarius]|uniref:DUF456 domain-containing protein n=1 Tax=Kytococcus sedentarius TaxID=1276 RepID=UPI0035BBA27C